MYQVRSLHYATIYSYCFPINSSKSLSTLLVCVCIQETARVSFVLIEQEFCIRFQRMFSKKPFTYGDDVEQHFVAVRASCENPELNVKFQE